MTRSQSSGNARGERASTGPTVTVIVGYEYCVKDASGAWSDWEVLSVSTDAQAEQFKRSARAEVKWRHQEIEAAVAYSSRSASVPPNVPMHLDPQRPFTPGLVFAAIQTNAAAFSELQKHPPETTSHAGAVGTDA
jgi:hypothetical protein